MLGCRGLPVWRWRQQQLRMWLCERAVPSRLPWPRHVPTSAQAIFLGFYYRDLICQTGVDGSEMISDSLAIVAPAGGRPEGTGRKVCPLCFSQATRTKTYYSPIRWRGRAAQARRGRLGLAASLLWPHWLMPCRQNVEIDDHCHEPQSEHGEKSHPPPRQIGAVIVRII